VIKINPIKLPGNWFEGFALDLHTISSEFLGYDEYGHEVFDTKRSEMGELLYRLKYGSDKSVLNEILDVVVNFLNHRWKISKILDGIIPVPPSKADRDFQPVVEIAKGVSSRLQIPIYQDYLIKVKETPELKNIYEYEERLELLKDAFAVRNSLIDEKNILLFDDLYRSGATLNAITRVLYKQGMVGRVYVLVLTKTRSKS